MICHQKNREFRDPITPIDESFALAVLAPRAAVRTSPCFAEPPAPFDPPRRRGSPGSSRVDVQTLRRPLGLGAVRSHLWMSPITESHPSTDPQPHRLHRGRRIPLTYTRASAVNDKTAPPPGRTLDKKRGCQVVSRRGPGRRTGRRPCSADGSGRRGSRYASLGSTLGAVRGGRR